MPELRLLTKSKHLNKLGALFMLSLRRSSNCCARRLARLHGRAVGSLSLSLINGVGVGQGEWKEVWEEETVRNHPENCVRPLSEAAGWYGASLPGALCKPAAGEKVAGALALLKAVGGLGSR